MAPYINDIHRKGMLLLARVSVLIQYTCLGKQADRVGAVQSRVEKALGRSYSTLQYLKGACKRVGLFTRICNDKRRGNSHKLG